MLREEDGSISAADLSRERICPISRGGLSFNFVAGRSELTPFPEEDALGIIFIGEKVLSLQPVIEAQIAACAIPLIIHQTDPENQMAYRFIEG